MSDGSLSGLKLEIDQGPWIIAEIPKDAVVRKITVHGNFEFGGVQFFDGNNSKLLEAGYIALSKYDIAISEGERIIGIQSFKFKNDKEPRQTHMRFVIGRLE